MTIFASVSIPPAPCGAWDCTGCQTVQYHEPNPILVEFRSDVDLNPQIPIWYLALIWVDRDLFVFEVKGATLAHADHARRVLTRLANLTKGENV